MYRFFISMVDTSYGASKGLNMWPAIYAVKYAVKLDARRRIDIHN